MNKHTSFSQSPIKQALLSALTILMMVPSGQSHGQEQPQDLAADLEPIRATFALPGVSAMAVKQGRIMAQGTAGVRRQGAATPITITDPVNIASCTKWMTATIAGRLVDRGIISWGTKVRDLLTNYTSFHSSFHDATLEQLLAHRAGVEEGSTWESAHWSALMARAGSVQSIRRWVTEITLTDPPQVAPGTYLYSNQGYTVAATLMELASGKSWETLMQEEIFSPLDMISGRLGVTYTDALPPAGVVGHDLTNASGTPIPRSYWGASSVSKYQASNGPGGFVICNLRDWARFLSVHAIDGVGYLEPATAQKLRTSFVGSQGYALGVGAYDRTWATPGQGLTHSGDIFGEDSVFWMSPGRDLIVMAFTNTRTADGSAFTALDQIVGMLVSRYASAVPSGALLDDSKSLYFKQPSISVTEDTGEAVVTVARLWPATAAAAVAYTISSGSAVSGADFSASSQGVISFEPGEITKTITIPLVNDSVWEENESFTVTLGFNTNTPANGYSIANSDTLTVQILNDDPLPPVDLPSISAPVAGSKLLPKNTLFTWPAGNGATAYRLVVGNTAGASDVYDSGELTVLEHVIPSLPNDRRALFATLFTQVDGNWFHSEAAYVAAWTRPDLIGRASGFGMIGDNIYSTTGSNQIVQQQTKRSATKVFYVKLQNDCSYSEGFLAKITGSIFQRKFGVKVTYNGVNITTRLRNSGFVTPTLAPGASIQFTVELSALASATLGTAELNFSMADLSTRLSQDAFKIRYKVIP